jgi:hypothetical protein
MTTPAPGSALDRTARAAGQAAPDEFAAQLHQNDLESVSRPLTTVSVDPERPECAIFRTLVLQPVQARQLVPRDPRRRRAMIMAIDEPVIICNTQDQASSPDNLAAAVPYPAGFWLPAGIPVYLESRDLAWAFNPNATTPTRVSVMTERHENPVTLGNR